MHAPRWRRDKVAELAAGQPGELIKWATGSGRSRKDGKGEGRESNGPASALRREEAKRPISLEKGRTRSESAPAALELYCAEEAGGRRQQSSRSGATPCYSARDSTTAGTQDVQTERGRLAPISEPAEDRKSVV